MGAPQRKLPQQSVRSGDEQPGRWVALILPCATAGEARAKKRDLRGLGAVRVWQVPGGLRAVWPEKEAHRLEAAGLSGAALRSFTASDPGLAMSLPPVDRIAPNLALAPAWSGLEPSQELLIIDALTAFGAGDHPSTRLNLLLLARLAAEGFAVPEACWLADVGAGTGVLALAMGLLFRQPVAAVDPDPAARRATLRNSRLNPLAGHLVHFVLADSRALSGSHPLVAANLPGPLLKGLLPELAGLLAPGGRLVVSGFRDEFAPEIEEASAGLGLLPASGESHLGWRGLVMANSL